MVEGSEVAGVGATLARNTPAALRGPEATEGAIKDHVRSTSACRGKRSLGSQFEPCRFLGSCQMAAAYTPFAHGPFVLLRHLLQLLGGLVMHLIGQMVCLILPAMQNERTCLLRIRSLGFCSSRSALGETCVLRSPVNVGLQLSHCYVSFGMCKAQIMQLTDILGLHDSRALRSDVLGIRLLLLSALHPDPLSSQLCPARGSWSNIPSEAAHRCISVADDCWSDLLISFFATLHRQQIDCIGRVGRDEEDRPF